MLNALLFTSYQKQLQQLQSRDLTQYAMRDNGLSRYGLTSRTELSYEIRSKSASSTNLHIAFSREKLLRHQKCCGSTLLQCLPALYEMLLSSRVRPREDESYTPLKYSSSFCIINQSWSQYHYIAGCFTRLYAQAAVSLYAAGSTLRMHTQLFQLNDYVISRQVCICIFQALLFDIGTNV